MMPAGTETGRHLAFIPMTFKNNLWFVELSERLSLVDKSNFFSSNKARFKTKDRFQQSKLGTTSEFIGITYKHPGDSQAATALKSSNILPTKAPILYNSTVELIQT